MPYSISISNERTRRPTKTFDRLSEAKDEATRHSGDPDLKWAMNTEGNAVAMCNEGLDGDEWTYTIFHWSAT
jgi:hypothetical protein